LIDDYGFAVVQSAIEEILLRSEQYTRDRIALIPNGIYEASDQIDGDGISENARKINVKISVHDTEIEVDLTSSDSQSTGGMNCSHSVASSAVQFAIKSLTDPENPPNAGSYRPVRVITRSGSICDAKPPASIVGYGEVAYRVMDATFTALAPALRERAIASGSGSTGTVVISGRVRRAAGLKYFSTLELTSGAHGARSFADGINAMRCGPGNAGTVPIEVDEMVNPIRYERFEIAADTGGAGEFRGGNGLRRVFRILADEASVCICSDRHVTPPPGIFGGRAGSPARFVLDPGLDRERVLSSKTPYIPVQSGTIVLLQSAGGGGYGNPASRDPSRIMDDVRNGYVTEQTALETYGLKRPKEEQRSPIDRIQHVLAETQ
jgi:N-methylhydantoinase B